MWLKYLLAATLLYGAVVAVVYFAQTWLLFPTGMIAPAGPLPAEAERLELSTPSGHRLFGTHIRPVAARDQRIVILGFGGNGWNADTAAMYLHDLYPEADIVAFHYRGYAPSEGRPSAAALTSDAGLIHDFVRARFGDARIVAAGFSIGSAIAAALAAHRPLDGAILVTPFDSMTEVAASHYRWLPVRLLLRNRMEAAEALRTVDTPVAIVAGGSDRLIAPARTDALRRAVNNLVFDRTIAGAGHNDIYESPAFREAMRQALTRILQ